MLDFVINKDQSSDLLDGRARFSGVCAPAHPIEAARDASARLALHAAEGDAKSELPAQSLATLHESGLLLAPLPRRHGGAGLTDTEAARDLSAVLRLIGAGDLSAGRLYEGHINAVALVRRYGTEDQLADLARSIRTGSFSGVWNAEGGTPLSAIDDGVKWCLRGEKILASGAGLAIRPIVTPRTADGVIMLLADPVAPDRADLSRWTPRGMRGSATGTVNFDDVTVSNASRIGELDDYMRQPMFSGGAWRFCAVHLGAAERLLDLFRSHLRARGREGDPYQKLRIATATAACLTARMWIEKAAVLVSAGDGSADTTVAFVNLTRMVTERACLDVIEAVERGVGLAAFMRPDPIERIARDLSTYLRQPVPDLAMADAAAVVLASDRSAFDLWAS